MGVAPVDDGSAILPTTHASPLSHIRHSPEWELSKREHTRNQTALPGWASQDREDGFGGKWQSVGPKAVGGPRAAGQPRCDSPSWG